MHFPYAYLPPFTARVYVAGRGLCLKMVLLTSTQVPVSSEEINVYPSACTATS